MGAVKFLPVAASHVVDILGSTKGRDQPIMLMEKALMLVDQIQGEIFTDPNTVFFDPFCKAGEILLATAIKLCQTRNKKKTSVSTEQEISDELYLSNRFFALAPDERHYLLSLRTFYGNEKSHNKKITKNTKNGNYLSEVDGCLKREIFEKEFEIMIEFIKKAKPNSRIIAIGNPPYQESDGGGINENSSKPIYNFFVEKLIESKVDEFIVVIPARWFSDGKGLDSFREKIMNSSEVRSITYFQQSEKVFPTVQIKGGICFLNFKKGFKGKTIFKKDDEEYSLNLNEFDMIIDDPLAISIIRKIKNTWSGDWLSDHAWPRNGFGIHSDYFKKNKESTEKHAIQCYSMGRKIKLIRSTEVKKNIDKISLYKVAIPKAYGKGMSRCSLPKNHFFIIEPNQITTETYSILSCFSKKSDAESFLKFVKTDFVIYLLGLRKITQNISRDSWAWVPFINAFEPWSEEKLFKLFNFTAREIAHLKKKAQEWS